MIALDLEDFSAFTIAKSKDGRNILYDANVKIKEGISIDKNATSLRSKKNTKQAVKVPMPSNGGLYHKKSALSSGKGKKIFIPTEPPTPPPSAPTWEG